MDPLTVAIGVVGHAVAVALAWVIYRDALAQAVSRPRFWAGLVGVTVLLGVWLLVFTDAPLTGVLLTANTGFVLYGFEREVANEGEDQREPGTLPEQK